MVKSNVYKITKLSEKEFSHLANKLSPISIPIEQTPTWGQFDNKLPNRKFLGSFRYDDSGGRLIALGSATLNTQRGRAWVWFKHGPIFTNVPNSKSMEKMCSTLKEQFSNIGNTRPLFIRLSTPTKIKQLLQPFEHTMYDQTIQIDLSDDIEKIRFAMSQTSRQEIKKANSLSVKIEKYDGLKATKVFKLSCYKILQETAQRAGFSVHPLSYYETFLTELNGATLYTAKLDDKVSAWAIITVFKKTALYYYGASNLAARNSGSAYLLQWQIINDLKKAGMQSYDLMGIASPSYPSLKNVTNFKQKFSKNIVQVPATYDLPISKLKYRLLSSSIKLKRSL